MRDTSLVNLMQHGEANRHHLLTEIDPESNVEYEKFDPKIIRDEVELVFLESHSEAEQIDRLTAIFHDMAEYDVRTVLAYITDFQEKRFDALSALENSSEETEVSSKEVHPLLRRRFGRRAAASATIAAGTGGAIFAQLMNLRF